MKTRKFTDYNKCLDYLFNLERAGMKYDLNNITSILDFLGNPQESYKSVHIAGTNGKGTVASVINSVLMEAGFKTGIYTSPHIMDFRERVLVNGKMIGKKFVLDFTNKLVPLIEKIKPSFYEVNTAMAFEYFKLKRVKYAVIETGLGGRLDSTNVLVPLVSVITSISIEHTEYLGKTIEKIAYEKAGIIKKGVPCVIGDLNKSATDVIKKKCKSEDAKLIYSKKAVKIDVRRIRENGFNFNLIVDGKEVKNISFPVPGDYQVKNIRTASAALESISKQEGFSLSRRALKEGFKKLKDNSMFYGRFEMIHKSPGIIIDTSHNAEALENIRDNLKSVKYKKLYVIFGLLEDKDKKSCMKVMEKLDGEIILTKPDYKRAEEAKNLYRYATRKKKYTLKPVFEDAVSYVMGNAGRRDLILVTGSFFMVSNFLSFLNKYYK